MHQKTCAQESSHDGKTSTSPFSWYPAWGSRLTRARNSQFVTQAHVLSCRRPFLCLPTWLRWLLLIASLGSPLYMVEQSSKLPVPPRPGRYTGLARCMGWAESQLQGGYCSLELPGKSSEYLQRERVKGWGRHTVCSRNGDPWAQPSHDHQIWLNPWVWLFQKLKGENSHSYWGHHRRITKKSFLFKVAFV